MTTTSAHSTVRDTRLARLAGWSQRHHWSAIGLWILTLVAITVGAASAGTDYRSDFSMPGTESQQLLDAYAEHSPQQEGDSVIVVLQAAGGVEAQQQEVDSLLADLRGLDHVAAAQQPEQFSEDGTLALATVLFDDATGLIPYEEKKLVVDTALGHGSENLRVELSGDAVREVEEGGGGGAEGAGVIAALVILLFLFGSLLAAALPLITAVLAVGTTFGAVGLLSHTMMIPDYTPPILMLVGLGVGIDYALLIFARYRSELLGGADRDTAARTALDTAGRSVLFAGATVVIALLGLYTLGLGALEGVALGVTLTVLMTMLASLTLLPSLLTIFGPRIERNIRRHHARRRHEPGRRWRAWAGVVQRRPLACLAIATLALLALAAPALDMHLGFADAGNDSPGSTSREAYDLVTEGFGPGANGPLIVVTENGDQAAAQAAFDVLNSHEGVDGATAPQPSPDGQLFTSMAFPVTSPQDEATGELVRRLRADLPEGVLVGGPTAASVDFSAAVADRFPLFVGTVVGLSALLLLAVFRSVAIALKAAALNLLSIGAALGVMVLVFQHGLLMAEPGPIEAFVPVMIFAIVFGLSMDYEVFLVSRMHEEWGRSQDATVAVREGLARTGGVITAAAAIMIVVFGAFVLSPDRMLQMMGLGMATAVLLDALVIRCLIVPAVMRLLGERAWWAPAWMQRALPGVRVE